MCTYERQSSCFVHHMLVLAKFTCSRSIIFHRAWRDTSEWPKKRVISTFLPSHLIFKVICHMWLLTSESLCDNQLRMEKLTALLRAMNHDEKKSFVAFAYHFYWMLIFITNACVIERELYNYGALYLIYYLLVRIFFLQLHVLLTSTPSNRACF